MRLESVPTIRIDDEVWRALQSQARPFVDTPNDVLRRVLGLDEGRKPSSDVPKKVSGPKQKFDKTDESEFRLPILRALSELGGRAPVADVLAHVHRSMKDRLKPDDYGKLGASREVRWENNAKWARKRMIEEGLLKANSPHGIWEITEYGRRQITQAK